jgi:hypothetical protein
MDAVAAGRAAVVDAAAVGMDAAAASRVDGVDGASVVVAAAGIFAVVVVGRSAAAVAGRAAVVDAVSVGMDVAGSGDTGAAATAIIGDATAMGECASTRRRWVSAWVSA